MFKDASLACVRYDFDADGRTDALVKYSNVFRTRYISVSRVSKSGTVFDSVREIMTLSGIRETVVVVMVMGVGVGGGRLVNLSYERFLATCAVKKYIYIYYTKHKIT